VFGHLLQQYGYWAIIGFFIAEGIGIPFPAETTLVTAAAYAAKGQLSLVGVMIAGTVGGVAGGTVGYWIGELGGLRLVRRFGKYVGVDDKALARAHAFFERRGSAAAFLGRFMSFFRTVIPMIIGISTMSFRRFTAFNALGSVVAATLFATLGFQFGKELPALTSHIRSVGLIAAGLLVAAVLVLAVRQRRIAG
jgi:membrane protein DedA with SNARE-associated domain